jgi:lipid A 3-O-deacylase
MHHGILLRRASGFLVLLALAAFSGTAALAQGTAGRTDSGLQFLGDEPSYVDFGVGAFDIQAHRESPTTPEGRVEFRYGRKFLFLGPAAGLLVNTRGGVFGYAGFYTDIAWGRLVLTPLGAVGFYSRGSSEDLGGTFQFRTSANVAYEFDDRSRLGVQFAHVSNAGLHKRNPGDNELLATYALPLPF